MKGDNLVALKTNGYTIFERMVVRKDGTKVPVEISNSLTVQDGKELVIAIVRDLGEWFRDKAELTDSEERFRAFVEHSLDGIVLLDGEGSVREWDHALERITGIMRRRGHRRSGVDRVGETGDGPGTRPKAHRE